MIDLVALGVGLGTAGIGIGVAAYLRHMRKRSKKFVLRSNRIKRYFR